MTPHLTTTPTRHRRDRKVHAPLNGRNASNSAKVLLPLFLALLTSSWSASAKPKKRARSPRKPLKLAQSPKAKVLQLAQRQLNVTLFTATGGNLKTRGYFVPSTNTIIANVPQALRVTRAYAVFSGFQVHPFYQRNRLVFLKMKPRRSSRRRRRGRVYPALALGSIKMKSHGAPRRGRKVLRWDPRRGVMKARVGTTHKKRGGCAEIPGSFDVTLPHRADGKSTLYFDTQGEIIGLGVCTSVSPKGVYTETVVPTKTLLKEMKILNKLQKKLAPQRSTRLPTVGLRVYTNRGMKNLSAIVVSDPTLAVALAPPNVQIRRVTLARHRYRTHKARWVVRNKLLVVRLPFPHRSTVPQHLVIEGVKPRGGASSTSSRIFFSYGNGLLHTERFPTTGVKRPQKSPRSQPQLKEQVRLEMVRPVVFGGSLFSNRGVPVVNPSGRLVGMRVDAGTGTSQGHPFAYDLMLPASRIQVAIAALKKKEARLAQKLFKGMAAARTKLRRALLSALVLVESPKPKSKRYGLVVSKKRLLVDDRPPGKSEELTLTALADSDAQTHKGLVAPKEPKVQAPPKLLRILRSGDVLALKNAVPSTSPLPLKWNGATDACLTKGAWLFVPVEDTKGKVQLLAIHHTRAKGNLVALRRSGAKTTSKAGAKGPWKTLSGIPAFLLCNGQVSTYRLTDGSRLRVGRNIAPWRHGDANYQLLPLHGLTYRKFESPIRIRKKRRRRRRKILIRKRRRRRRRRHIRRRRRRRRNRPFKYKTPRGWHPQIEVSMLGGLMTETARKDDEDNVLIPKRSFGLVGMGMVFRITRIRRSRIRGLEAFMGKQFSIEIPMSFEYTPPGNDYAEHGFRFRMGMGFLTELDLSNRVSLATGLGLLIPEVGFMVSREAGRDTEGGFYVSIPRFAFTYWLEKDTALRFRLAPFFGFRFQRDPTSELQHMRPQIGGTLTMGVSYH